MVIDFLQYLEMKRAQQAAMQAAIAAHEAELARRDSLEKFLAETLAELQAA